MTIPSFVENGEALGAGVGAHLIFQIVDAYHVVKLIAEGVDAVIFLDKDAFLYRVVVGDESGERHGGQSVQRLKTRLAQPFCAAFPFHVVHVLNL